MTDGYQIVPFSRTRDAGFLYSTFAAAMRDCWPWSGMRTSKLADDLTDILMREHVSVSALVDGRPIGVLIARPPLEVTWAYVAYPYRRMGIGSALLASVEFPAFTPIGVRYYTRATQRISLKRSMHREFYFRLTEDNNDKDSTRNRPVRV